MNKAQKKCINKYIKEVKHCFPFGYPGKKKIINELKTNLILFSNEYPTFTYNDLYDNFGSPNSYADSLINLTPPDELRNNIRMRKRSIFIILLVCFIFLVITIYAVIEVIKFQGHLATSGFEVIVIEEEGTIIEEDSTDNNQ